MKRYRNSSGKSGVRAYEIYADRILIEFAAGDIYVYSYRMPGKADVEQMKTLAEKGKGLSTYISQNVRDRYESKL